MWNIAVLAVLMAVAGIYAGATMRSVDRAQDQMAAAMAAEMGIYRQAVIGYFGDHDLLATEVGSAALKAGGYLPGWTGMAQQSAPLVWSNYRDANGVIYVYATRAPARNFDGELARLARNSLLAGSYGSGGTLRSAALGDTGIPLAALAGKSIQVGAPVWLAGRQ